MPQNGALLSQKAAVILLNETRNSITVNVRSRRTAKLFRLTGDQELSETSLSGNGAISLKERHKTSAHLIAILSLVMT